MQLLKDRILSTGTVRAGGILKVDTFINHMCDIDLFNEMGKEFSAHFAGKEINKILTIEASGIGIACITAQYFHCPVVYAKKAKSLNLDGTLYTARVHSYTYDKDYDITVSQNVLKKGDKVLILDDFLARGMALNGLLDVVSQAGAEVMGIGVIIEKGFQGGGDKLRARGYDVCSLAIVEEMNEDGIVFRD